MTWMLRLGKFAAHYGYRRHPMPTPKRAFWIQRYNGGDGDKAVSLWLFRRRVFHASWYAPPETPA